MRTSPDMGSSGSRGPKKSANMGHGTPYEKNVSAPNSSRTTRAGSPSPEKQSVDLKTRFSSSFMKEDARHSADSPSISKTVNSTVLATATRSSSSAVDKPNAHARQSTHQKAALNARQSQAPKAKSRATEAGSGSANLRQHSPKSGPASPLGRGKTMDLNKQRESPRQSTHHKADRKSRHGSNGLEHSTTRSGVGRPTLMNAPRPSVLNAIQGSLPQGAEGEYGDDEESKAMILEEWMYELPLFKECSRAFVETVLQRHSRLVFQPDRVLVSEGDEGESMYVIIWGFANVSIGNHIVGEVTTGACIGEAVVMGLSKTRTATVTARSVLEVLEVKEEEISAALEEFPEERKMFMAFAESRQEALRQPNAECLRKCPLMDGFSDRFIFLLHKRLDQKVAFAGDTIVVEGENSDKLILVLSGTVTVEIGGREVQNHVIGTSSSTVAKTETSSAVLSETLHQRGSLKPVNPRSSSVGGASQSIGLSSIVVGKTDTSTQQHFDRPAVFGDLNLLGLRTTAAASVTAQKSSEFRALPRTALLEVLEEAPEEDQKLAKELMEKQFSAPLLRGISYLAKCSEAFITYLSNHFDEHVFGPDQSLTFGLAEKCVFTVISGTVTGCIEDSEGFAGDDEELENGQFYGQITQLCIDMSLVHNVTTHSLTFVKVIWQSVVLKGFGEFHEDRPHLLEAARFQMSGEGEAAPDEEESGLTGARAALRMAPLFQGTPVEVIEGLIDHLELCVYLPGDIIIQQDTSGDTMYIIADGTVDVLVRSGAQGMKGSNRRQSLATGTIAHRQSLWDDDSSKDKEVVRILGPGATFGEMAVLGISRLRLATVRANCLCLAWVLERTVILGMLQSYPNERKKFVELVNVNLDRSVTKRMTSLALLKSFDAKFAVVLGLHCQRRVYFPGQSLVREGRVGENMFVVNVGVLSIEMKSENISTLHAGSYFGASQMLGTDRLWFVTLVAKNVCHILVISESCWRYALEKYPESRDALRELQVDIYQKNEKLKFSYKRTLTRKRLIKRMEWVHVKDNLQPKSGGVTFESPEGENSEKADKQQDNLALRRLFSGWLSLTKRNVEIQRARDEEKELGNRRMKEWLDKKAAAMAKVAHDRKWKDALIHNLTNRGPLRLPTSEPAVQSVQTAREVEPNLQAAGHEALLEIWPKRPESRGYSLNVYRILQHLPASSAAEVLARHNKSSSSPQASLLKSLSPWSVDQAPTCQSPDASRDDSRPRSCPPCVPPQTQVAKRKSQQDALLGNDGVQRFGEAWADVSSDLWG